jgi:tRNA 5-methylaminomethyl-2-thiouridine biosynthesis bifunctional protein
LSTTTPSNTDRLRSVGLEKPDTTFESSDHALIIGAGLAGCATARVLSAAGMRCTVFDAKHDCASETSSVPVAIFKPPTASGTVEQRYLANAFQRLLAELQNLSLSPVVSGLVQLTDKHQYEAPWQHVSAETANQISGCAINSPVLHLPCAGAISPARLCRQWLSHPNISLVTNTRIESLVQEAGDWQVLDSGGTVRGRGQLVVLANANAAARFAEGLSLVPVKGQIDCFSPERVSVGSVICNHGYVVPTAEGLWSGATFHRHIENNTVSMDDTRQNLQFCRRFHAVKNTPARSWAGVRCTTADRMPLIGPVADTGHIDHAYRDLHHGRSNQSFPGARYRQGIYTVVGLGSRGAVQSLYGAECLADIVFGHNLLDEATRLAIHPARFLMKQKRRRAT